MLCGENKKYKLEYDENLPFGGLIMPHYYHYRASLDADGEGLEKDVESSTESCQPETVKPHLNWVEVNKE